MDAGERPRHARDPVCVRGRPRGRPRLDVRPTHARPPPVPRPTSRSVRGLLYL